MSDESYSATLEIQNRQGTACPGSSSFVKAIEDLNAEVSVERIGQTVRRLFDYGADDAGRSQGNDNPGNLQRPSGQRSDGCPDIIGQQQIRRRLSSDEGESSPQQNLGIKYDADQQLCGAGG